MYYRDYESRVQNLNEIQAIVENTGLAHTISLLAIVAGGCFGEMRLFRSLSRVAASAEAKRADRRILFLLFDWLGMPRPKDRVFHRRRSIRRLKTCGK